jgi:hypothetical protein
MSEFWNCEVKETTANGGNYHPPDFPKHYPSDTDIIIGICYQGNYPKHLETPDEAYQRSLNAKYYLWININPKHWGLIGDEGSPLDFLIFLSKKQGQNFRISWPRPFENYPKFNRSECYQIYPYRELIRRNFEPRAYITDRDVIIHKTYLRK